MSFFVKGEVISFGHETKEYLRNSWLLHFVTQETVHMNFLILGWDFAPWQPRKKSQSSVEAPGCLGLTGPLVCYTPPLRSHCQKCYPPQMLHPAWMFLAPYECYSPRGCCPRPPQMLPPWVLPPWVSSHGCNPTLGCWGLQSIWTLCPTIVHTSMVGRLLSLKNSEDESIGKRNHYRAPHTLYWPWSSWLGYRVTTRHPLVCGSPCCGRVACPADHQLHSCRGCLFVIDLHHGVTLPAIKFCFLLPACVRNYLFFCFQLQPCRYNGQIVHDAFNSIFNFEVMKENQKTHVDSGDWSQKKGLRKKFSHKKHLTPIQHSINIRFDNEKDLHLQFKFASEETRRTTQMTHFCSSRRQFFEACVERNYRRCSDKIISTSSFQHERAAVT